MVVTWVVVRWFTQRKKVSAYVARQRADKMVEIRLPLSQSYYWCTPCLSFIHQCLSGRVESTVIFIRTVLEHCRIIYTSAVQTINFTFHKTIAKKILPSWAEFDIVREFQRPNEISLSLHDEKIITKRNEIYVYFPDIVESIIFYVLML